MPNCPKCGHEEVPCCSVPGCKEKVDVYSRVVGYLTNVATWNDGKQEEFRDRTEYETWNSAKIAQDKTDYT